MKESHTKVCQICWESMDERLCQLLPCEHEFHLSCIRAWHRDGPCNKICPLCRTNTTALVDMDHNITIDLSLRLDLIFDQMAFNIGSQMVNHTYRGDLHTGPLTTYRSRGYFNRHIQHQDTQSSDFNELSQNVPGASMHNQPTIHYTTMRDTSKDQKDTDRQQERVKRP
ncbi:HBL094Cp [Eremothecium sinecaudum]|uniref:HBL094Cp n=1 Tax=Eremothecium sinecaudum TaxID=45286 RepID=A0A109UWF5_9SACH|nr:HBL094Cp [Eremothecium sinecaudum]AMD18808.1 HBL094Cp [Eremothecium sinecaudum]